MIKVLQLLPTLSGGGIETTIYNYYINIDHTKIKMDFAVFIPSNSAYTKFFEEEGCKIFVLPQKSKGIKNYCQALGKIIDENDYDIVHAHQSYMSFIPLYVAKKHKVKGRISHSHTSQLDSNLFVQKLAYAVGKCFNKICSNKMLACGKLAAEFVYGKNAVKKGKIEILPNAIDLDKFGFNKQLRADLRAKYHILEDEKVIGIVGRLSHEKNIKYVINIAKMLNNSNKMVVVGDGVERENIDKLISENQLQNKVIMLGKKDNVSELYNMFDLLVMPSLHEGFPMVAVEAIANGLQIVLADTITDEFSCYDGVKYCSLDDVSSWVNVINIININDRKNNLQALKDNNLDIKEASNRLMQIYENLVK